MKYIIIITYPVVNQISISISKTKKEAKHKFERFEVGMGGAKMMFEGDDFMQLTNITPKLVNREDL